MIDEAEVRSEWLARAHAVGRAQARHFWVTLVVALFFFALRNSTPVGQVIGVPVIELQLNADAVLAAGPAVLALLIVAALGTMAAWGDALRKARGAEWASHADRLDQAPIAIDFALYAVRGWPMHLGDLAKLVTYPSFFSLVVAEAVLEYVWLWKSHAPARVAMLVVAAPLLVAAVILVLALWYRRIADFRTQWKARWLTTVGD